MICESSFLPSLQLLTGRWIRNFTTPIRAYFPKQSAFSVFRHRLTTNGARHFDRKAIGTELIEGINILAPLLADFTSLANAARIGFVAGSTGYTSRVFSRLPHDGYRWSKRTTIGTRLQIGIVARLANAIFAAICLTENTKVLCHIAIIPQLPNLRGEI